MGERKIGLGEIRNLKPGETIWDDGKGSVAGFGARRQRGPAVAYVLKFRTAEGRQRWHTIGRHGAPWNPDTAREEAKRLLGEVVTGGDPAAAKSAKRKAATVADLCAQYFADAEAGKVKTRRREAKKASTLATDKGRIERHIVPLLGKLPVAAVTSDDIEDFMHAVAEGKTAGKTKTANKHGLARVSGGKGTASRTVGLLGAIFAYALHRKMRPDNPVRGTIRFADGKRKRRIGDDEYAALGDALRKGQAASVWPAALAATRFLALTGWRSGEALGLRWAEIDLARRTATLADTKTGKSIRPLSRVACDVLRGLSRTGELVFPASRGEGRMSGFPKLWARVAKLGDLPDDITPHVLRHSFASLANDLGYSEPTIAALVGHKGRTITSRYVHSADAVLLAAADVVADRTTELMGQARPAGVVVELPKPVAA